MVDVEHRQIPKGLVWEGERERGEIALFVVERSWPPSLILFPGQVVDDRLPQPGGLVALVAQRIEANRYSQGAQAAALRYTYAFVRQALLQYR